MANETACASAVELMRARAGIYRMFASLYFKELTIDQMRSLADSDLSCFGGLDPAIAEGVRDVTSAVRHTHEVAREDLATDYAHTFLSAGSTKNEKRACPFESVFTSDQGLFMQEARDEVYRLMLAEHVEPDARLHVPEDHISFECEFMAVLGERAAEALMAGDGREAVRLLGGAAEVPCRAFGKLDGRLLRRGARVLPDAVLRRRGEDDALVRSSGRRADGRVRRPALQGGVDGHGGFDHAAEHPCRGGGGCGHARARRLLACVRGGGRAGAPSRRAGRGAPAGLVREVRPVPQRVPARVRGGRFRLGRVSGRPNAEARLSSGFLRFLQPMHRVVSDRRARAVRPDGRQAGRRPLGRFALSGVHERGMRCVQGVVRVRGARVRRIGSALRRRGAMQRMRRLRGCLRGQRVPCVRRFARTRFGSCTGGGLIWQKADEPGGGCARSPA